MFGKLWNMFLVCWLISTGMLKSCLRCNPQSGLSYVGCWPGCLYSAADNSFPSGTFPRCFAYLVKHNIGFSSSKMFNLEYCSISIPPPHSRYTWEGNLLLSKLKYLFSVGFWSQLSGTYVLKALSAISAQMWWQPVSTAVACLWLIAKQDLILSASLSHSLEGSQVKPFFPSPFF